MHDRRNFLGLNNPSPSNAAGATWSDLAGAYVIPSLILCGGLIVAALKSYLWLAAVVFAMIPVVVLGCRLLGPRPFAIFGLICSIPSPLAYHIAYRPNIGATDGITIQLVDVWILWLSIQYALLLRRGAAKHVRGLLMICFPLALLGIADLFSFVNSSDIPFSIWGTLDHVRGFALVLILAITLAQGNREIRAASLAVVCSVMSIGAICIVEMIVKKNIYSDLSDLTEPYGAFRAGGLQFPTTTAAYLASLIPLIAIEYFFPLSRRRRFLASAGLCIGIVGLGCTLTRAAIGFFAIATLPLIISLVRKGLVRVRHILIFAVALTVTILLLEDQISKRLDEDAEGFNGRTGLAGTALNMASTFPIFGVGVNNYGLKMHGFIRPEQRQDFEFIVHNKYLLTLSETGLLGFTGFVWLVAVISYRAAVLSLRKPPLGVGIFSSVIVIVLDMNFEPYTQGPVLLNLWAIFAFVIALWSELDPRLAPNFSRAQSVARSISPLDRKPSVKRAETFAEQ